MTLAEEFETAAKELRKPIAHHYCEDGWYSCPLSDEGCLNPGEGETCNCGAEKANARHAEIADLLDRAAELARDNERVVQSIVGRKVTKDAK